MPSFRDGVKSNLELARDGRINSGIANLTGAYYRVCMKSISVKLPPPLAKWLTHQSTTLKRSKSELVRDALERQRQSKNGPSCHDLARDLCGSFQGPSDLSTNPKYMQGFGE